MWRSGVEIQAAASLFQMEIYEVTDSLVTGLSNYAKICTIRKLITRYTVYINIHNISKVNFHIKNNYCHDYRDNINFSIIAASKQHRSSTCQFLDKCRTLPSGHGGLPPAASSW